MIYISTKKVIDEWSDDVATAVILYDLTEWCFYAFTADYVLTAEC